ncbi:MAG: hypothetical protein R3B72_28035 [Polyangiaceae bacterium]
MVEELGAAAYLALVRYILEVTEHDELEVLEFSRALGPVAEQVVMTGAEKLIEKGRAKGLEQGLEQGRATGQAEAVVTLLEKRFGGLSERQRVVIHGASLEQLGGWLERVLEVGSVEELIGG